MRRCIHLFDTVHILKHEERRDVRITEGVQRTRRSKAPRAYPKPPPLSISVFASRALSGQVSARCSQQTGTSDPFARLNLSLHPCLLSLLLRVDGYVILYYAVAFIRPGLTSAGVMHSYMYFDRNNKEDVDSVLIKLFTSRLHEDYTKCITAYVWLFF